MTKDNTNNESTPHITIKAKAARTGLVVVGLVLILPIIMWVALIYLNNQGSKDTDSNAYSPTSTFSIIASDDYPGLLPFNQEDLLFSFAHDQSFSVRIDNDGFDTYSFDEVNSIIEARVMIGTNDSDPAASAVIYRNGTKFGENYFNLTEESLSVEPTTLCGGLGQVYSFNEANDKYGYRTDYRIAKMIGEERSLVIKEGVNESVDKDDRSQAFEQLVLSMSCDLNSFPNPQYFTDFYSN